MHASFLSLLFISLCGITNALRLPVTARSALVTRDGMAANHTRGVRTQMMHTSTGDQVDIENAKDVVYATNITLGGKEFPIQLDTGSSDVWVMPPFALDIKNQTGIAANLTFGIGQANGEIDFAEMSLGDYKVSSQAFLNVTNATDFGAIFSNGIFGIMGLAFDQASTVFVENFVQSGTNSTAGRTFLSNIFAQNVSAPNIFTVLLGRTDDTDGNQEGIFTIAEYDDAFPDISCQPKLPRTPAQLTQLTTLPRWSAQMDGMKVNGKSFQFNKSAVSEAAPGKTVAVLDTGFTFSQIPAPAVDFIYQSIPGAIFNNATGLYEVPCENTTSLVFEFGGKEFPIDPLDITVVANNGNKTVCNNAFRTISLPPDPDVGLDMILGVSFLKNAYVSFDFGDWTPQNTTGVPFMQMLSTTDAKKAADTFPGIRKKQVAAADAKNNNSTAGSITLEPLELIQTGKVRPGALRRSFDLPTVAQRMPRPQNTRVRVIVTGHGMPVTLPFMPQSVNNCAHTVLMAYGPVVLALLSGVAVLSLISAVTGAIIALRLWMSDSSDEEEGYEPLQLKEDF